MTITCITCGGKGQIEVPDLSSTVGHVCVQCQACEGAGSKEVQPDPRDTRIAELEARLARVAEGWDWITADFLNFTHVGGYVLFQIGEPEMAVASKFFRDPSEENWKRLHAATDEAPDEGPLDAQSRAVEKYAERIAELEAESLEIIKERDRAQEALSEAHAALGGDGEWVCRLYDTEPGESGDLHEDIPELALAASARIAELEAENARLREELARYRKPAPLTLDGDLSIG